MPVHTGSYHSPLKYPNGPDISYETAMGVPPHDPGPVFHFRKRHGEINWRKLSSIDVERVARELDFVTLQENISTVTFCNIDAVSDLDPLFSKLFKLSQFTIEYLLHSQEYLQSVIGELEGKLDSAGLEHAAAQEKIQEMASEVQKLKSENKKRRKMIEQQQMLIESGASSYYKCPHCEKAFMNASFLQGHMQRKHPGSVNYIGDVIAHSQREQSKLAGKLQNLDEDLQQERLNFTEKLKKAEEDKAAWGARTRRDMQRWKKEEEGKWRRELDSMKQSFLEEIKNLKSQEMEYKKQISTLQVTMDERHSNLGDLQDDMEGEKQRLHVYEERIKTLERTNAEKQHQLQKLASEMSNLRDHNKQALMKHQKSISDTYDAQLRQIKDKVERQKSREVVPVTAPVAASPPESYEEVDEALDPISAMRREQAQIAAKMRPLLVQMMEGHIQRCGIDPKAPGISTHTLTNKLMVLKTERQRKARENPQYFTIRDQKRRQVEERALARYQGSPPRKRRGRAQTLPRQRFSASPSRPSAVGGGLSHTPSPGRRTDKTMMREELDTRYQDEEEEGSAWDSEVTEEDHPPAPRVEQRAKPPSIPQPATSKTTTPAALQPPPASTSKKNIESWDSDDFNDLLSPDSEIPSAKSKETKVQQLGAQIQSQLQSRTAHKPPTGGVDISGANAQTSSTQIKKLDSDDDDFSPISSLHESPKPAPRTAQAPTSKVRLSTASNSTNTFGTSVWGSNQGKPDAGTGGKNETVEQESDWDDDISDL